MSTTGPADFSCASCGKRYPWSPSFAGRKVRCVCGTEFRSPESSEPDDVYDIAAEPQPPQPAAADVAIPPKLYVPDFVAGRTLGYRSAPAAHERNTKLLMTVWFPIWLLAGSIAIEVIYTWFSGYAFVPVMNCLGVGLVIGTLLKMIGILIAVKIRKIEIGSYASALLRLSAVSVAPGAASDLISPILRSLPFLGFVVALIIEFILYFALLGAMFDLDESDTWFCVCVIFLASTARNFIFLIPWAELSHMHLIRPGL